MFEIWTELLSKSAFVKKLIYLLKLCAGISIKINPRKSIKQFVAHFLEEISGLYFDLNFAQITLIVLSLKCGRQPVLLFMCGNKRQSSDV